MSAFSATPDEPMHVAAGLEILRDHHYGIQLQNPPLLRVFLALGPWLAGVHLDPSRGVFDQLNDIFHSTGHYRRDLALARGGSVLIFLIAALATWRLARRESTPAIAALATLLFTTQPVILGYAGIANHDAASVTGLAVALWALSWWLDRPTPIRAAAFGAAYAFAIAMKFACILYVPVAGAVFIAIRSWMQRANSDCQCTPLRRGRVIASAALALAAGALTLWASYGFVIGVIPNSSTLLQVLGPGKFSRALTGRLASLPVPAPHLFGGIFELFATNRGGHPAYAFGLRSTHGWWWYFPACLGLKTTLGTLLLFAAGVARARGNRAFAPMAGAAAAILASALTAHLDVGVRYILPLYVPFSIACACAAWTMFERSTVDRLVVIALLGWHLVGSARSHPDYFPYFNELAGRDPSRYLIDSNLDWGQDVLRLRRRVLDEKIESLGVCLMGPHDFARLGFPAVHPVEPWVPARGWVAISDHPLRMTIDGWGWLPKSYERVGTSIRLYHID